MCKWGNSFRDERLGIGDYNWSDSDRASGAKKAASYHAVTAVGYDDDRGSLLIMNSWGTQWKEDGFVWAQYDNFRSIGEGSWCEEAHVIGVKRVAPYNVVLEVPVRRRGPKAQPKKRRFSLKYDRKVYEFSDLISPEQWRFDDIAATENKLYVLRRNQAIYRMNDERNGTYSWTHLSTGPLANRKVTMLAAEDTSDLHALTDTNELFQLNERSGAWSKVNLPDRQSKPVDIRVVDGKMFATTSTGKAFIHSDQGSSWMLAQ